MIDPTAIRVLVIRCDCEKVHAASGIGAASVCACGRPLYPQLWRADQRKAGERDA